MKSRISKVLIVTSICIAMLLSISACGNTSNTPAQNSTTQQATSAVEPTKAPVKLTFSTYNAWWNQENLKLAIKMYQDETQNTIDPQIYPDDQFVNVIKTKAAAGDVPDVFALNCNVTLFGEGQIEPLDGPWVSKIDMTRAEKNLYARDGKIYVAPYGPCAFLGMMYNKSVMEKAGVTLPIKTYNDFVAACEAIKKTGVTPLYVPNKDAWTAQLDFAIGSPYIAIESPQYLEKLFTNKMKYSQEPLLVDMFKRVVDLKTKGYMNADMASATMAMAEQALVEGKAAMVAGGDWLSADIAKNYPDKVDSLGMTACNWGDNASNLGVLKTGSGNGLWIPVASKQKDAAKEFVNFVMSDKIITAMYEVVPGSNELGIPTKANSWAIEMQGYLDSGVAKALDDWSQYYNFKPGSGLETGDVAANGQNILAGKDIVKALDDTWSDAAKKNKAKGIPEF